MRNALYIILLMLAIVPFWACDDGFDDYSHSPQDILSFSIDTLSFDTILTGVNTPTASFRVYNKNKKALLISSIRLKDQANSGYRINVDGLSGSRFEDIEIRSKDSIYIFVEAKLNATGVNAPVSIIDEIEFITNTVAQSVRLEAYGQDAFVWKGMIIDADTLLSNEKPYLLYDSLWIKAGATLRLTEGTTLYMHNGTNIRVDGSLQITGSAERPVVIRGDRFDNIFTNASYDLVPGQWGGITFAAQSYDNIIEHAHIRNGSSAMTFEPSDPSLLKLNMKNVVVSNFKGNIIRAVNSHITAENCEFSNARDTLIALIGGNYSFSHCTMANYYLSSREAGWGISDNRTLVLSNDYLSAETGETVLYPIQRADFKNTIIWGSKAVTGTSGIRLNEHEDSSMAYYFLNCLLPNKGTNDDDFVDCVWATDPLFLKPSPGKGEDEDYLQYSFVLTDKSPARNVADIPTALLLPRDIKGVDRFLDEGPDIGGYEFIPED